MSPKERYSNDPAYRQLVDLLESFIYKAQFTPSEIREASILASINYEMHHVRKHMILLTPELHKQLSDLHEIIEGES